MYLKKISKVVTVIVAHPDDETLWAGGTILSHPEWNWFIITLTRGSDEERAEKFRKALKSLGATGIMGDMDDGPEQIPLDITEVQKNILSLMPPWPSDLVMTHHPDGEYTRHLRHEETSRAVIGLWQQGKLTARELWFFAYEDGGKQYFPRPILKNTRINKLSEKIWLMKYSIINQVFGFDEKSWEAQTTPREESFIRITSPDDAIHYLISDTEKK